MVHTWGEPWSESLYLFATARLQLELAACVRLSIAQLLLSACVRLSIALYLLLSVVSALSALSLAADSARPPTRKVPCPCAQGDQRPWIHSGKGWGKGDKGWGKGYLWFTFTGTSTSGILRHHDEWTVKGTRQVYQGTGHLTEATQGKAGRGEQMWMSSTMCDPCLVMGPIPAQISKGNQSTGGPQMFLHQLNQKRVLNLCVKKNLDQLCSPCKPTSEVLKKGVSPG